MQAAYLSCKIEGSVSGGDGDASLLEYDAVPIGQKLITWDMQCMCVMQLPCSYRTFLFPLPRIPSVRESLVTRPLQ